MSEPPRSVYRGMSFGIPLALLLFWLPLAVAVWLVLR